MSHCWLSTWCMKWALLFYPAKRYGCTNSMSLNTRSKLHLFDVSDFGCARALLKQWSQRHSLVRFSAREHTLLSLDGSMLALGTIYTVPYLFKSSPWTSMLVSTQRLCNLIQHPMNEARSENAIAINFCKISQRCTSSLKAHSMLIRRALSSKLISSSLPGEMTLLMHGNAESFMR